MADLTLSVEDRDAIKAVLLMYRASGDPNPLLPADVDLDGDGIVDSFGLDLNDEVIVVRGAEIKNTVYVSDGDDKDFSVDLDEPDYDEDPE